ncbi:triose-phosphate isomerase [archaeon 13_2_20CM_2_52_21]|nr:MAG: triose-phosphate isomerase [archaeon 13_2_20CM_2_52_21]OLD09027.1 MAG: triose-phosphate isomerase [Crenarchaeota archaeon 13_1_40CM_3_52_4]OLD44024.1 MAG: triose-phosphate isomerase [archaeon 13_1_40CM_2_52_4]
MKSLRGFLLVVNFKTYIEATGKRAIELAKVAAEVSRETGVTVIVAPQFTDIEPISKTVDIPVFSQHVDSIKPGAYTGHVLADAVKSAGAEGTLLNHSERRIGSPEIATSVRLCADSDLQSLVCADTAQAGVNFARMKPDMIAIEPPELIGTGISVSKARPELITKSLKQIRKVNESVRVLCGAGVTTAEDVSKALDLGSEGVLVASAVVKSKDPGAVLQSMASKMASK